MKKILLALMFLYLLLCSSVYFLHDHLIYQPVTLDKNFNFDFPVERVDVAPSLQVDLAHFKTKDSLKRGDILYFHGNTDNLSRWSQYAQDYTSRGYDVYMVDYRGYGRSDGEASIENIYNDALEIYDHIEFDQPPIIVGRSLGTSVASYLASKRQARHLILESPFSSIHNLFRQKSLYLLLPFDLENNHDNLANLQEVGIPVSIIHGMEDELVPVEESEALVSVIKNFNKLYIIPNADHKNFQDFNEYQQALDEILLRN